MLRKAKAATAIQIGAITFHCVVPRAKRPRNINDGPRTGRYQKKRDGIILFDETGEPRVFISRGSSPFMVTCHRTDAGQIRYMFGLASADQRWLFGRDALNGGDESTHAKAAIEAAYPAMAAAIKASKPAPAIDERGAGAISQGV